jgi:hypothetical protein
MKNSVTNPKKPPIIRPGQRTPFKKATAEQIEKRVDFVEEQIEAGIRRRSELHKLVGKKFGVNWRTVDEYLGRARARLLERLRQTKDEFRSQSLATYQSILKNGNSREKILAQERIDKLLGLEAPRIFGHGGADGMPPIKTETTDKTARPMRGLTKDTLKEIIALAKKKKS